jgi:hypothetical protein
MSYVIVLEFDGTSRVLRHGLSRDGAGRLMQELADAWAKANAAVYTHLDDDTYLLDGGVMRREAASTAPDEPGGTGS